MGAPRLKIFDRAGQVPVYYKRFSSVTFRILADARKTLCNANIRKTLYNSIIQENPYVEPDMLEKRSRNAMACTPLVATRQDAHLGPIVEGVLYGWWHGCAYTSVSRALLFASWQTLGKPYVTQTSGNPMY